jgi:hypothetical protein
MMMSLVIKLKRICELIRDLNQFRFKKIKGMINLDDSIKKTMLTYDLNNLEQNVVKN